jgi:adenylate cyclase
MSLEKRLSQTTKLEIEKKYLISPFININLENFDKKEISQWYFNLDWQRLRLRKENNNWNIRFIITKKEEIDMWYHESEIEIDEEEFNGYWEKIECSLEKIRYIIPYGIYVIELDIFKWNKEWLMIAEIEFDENRPIDWFRLPAWFGKELNISNYEISKQTAEQLKKILNI